MHKRCRYLFILILLFSFSVHSQNNDEQQFISHIFKTYQYSRFNNYEYSRQLLYNTLRRQNIPIDTISTYTYIPFYRVELKNLTCFQRRNLYRNRYFSYVSTKKLEFVEMYVFKDSHFYGTLREGIDNIMYFVQGELIETRANTFFHQIYEKVNPEMTIYIRRPYSEMFIIKDEKINPIRYEDGKWNIYGLNVFYNDKKFDRQKGWVEREGDKYLIWK